MGMKLALCIVFWGAISSLEIVAGKTSRLVLDDDNGDAAPAGLPPGISPPGEKASDKQKYTEEGGAPGGLPPGVSAPGGGTSNSKKGQNDGAPGGLPPGISPPGEDSYNPYDRSGGGRSAGGTCCGRPVVIPYPEIPPPTCPNGLPPVYRSDGELQYCLPTAQQFCPPNSACWYNGINYYCCPMEPAPGYGPARPPGSYVGKPPGGQISPPGSIPKGVRPPSGPEDGSSAPGSLPKGINPPSGETSEEITAPGTAPKGVNPPSEGGQDNSAPASLPKGVSPPSGEGAQPPGKLPESVKPPSNGIGPYLGKKPKRPRYRGSGPGGLQPPPYGAGDFPNPFCCGGDTGFHPPSHWPRNVNAPSERVIGLIQYFPGAKSWPPKETGPAKFGGPIKPDFLWFPGQHPHFTNELSCCGGKTGGQSGGGYGSAGRPSLSSTSTSSSTASTTTEATATGETAETSTIETTEATTTGETAETSTTIETTESSR